jgi:hypothetical protein
MANAPSPAWNPSAVWTGRLLIVWGGRECEVGATCRDRDTGARYDPVADAWTPTSNTGAASPRSGHLAFWTGRLMLVWGGSDGSSHSLSSGGIYVPGHFDDDEDGFLDCEDCDDSDPHVHPGAAERCNGVDDDCDGSIDEGCAVSSTEGATCGVESRTSSSAASVH